MFVTAIYNQMGADLTVSRRGVGNIHVTLEHPIYILAQEEIITVPTYRPEDSARDFIEIASQGVLAYLVWARPDGSACYLAAADRDLTDVINGDVSLGDTGAEPMPGDSDEAGSVA